ncbi:MAG: D-alanine--D-alanine ligase [Planctomycetota bacterium]
MKKTAGRPRRIGVIMGGASNERDISLMSGKNVLAALVRLGYDAVGIDARDYLPDQVRKRGIDAAFIALHGRGGEDGTIQGFLECLDLPYTGSGVTASALAMDKMATKRILRAEGMPTPDFMPIGREGELGAVCTAVLDRFGLPVVIKPNDDGSSIGVKIVNDKGLLFRAVQEVRNEYETLFAEKFIKGQELTVGVIGTGAQAVALPSLELAPKQDFYTYEAKYTEGLTDFIIPAAIGDAMETTVQELAVKLHNLLGCRDLSRTDFILEAGTGVPQILEINTIPGFTNLSDLPAEARAAGLTFDDLVERIMQSAFGEKAERGGKA